MFVRHALDTLEDSTGRLFQKISSNHLPIARQQIGVSNRKQAQSTSTSPKKSETPVALNALLSSNVPDKSPHVFECNEFSAIRFDQAEQTNDNQYFRQCLLKYPHEVYLWTQKSGNSYSNFLSFMHRLRTSDPALYREWDLVKDGRGAAASSCMKYEEKASSNHTESGLVRKPNRKSKKRRAAAYRALARETRKVDSAKLDTQPDQANKTPGTEGESSTAPAGGEVDDKEDGDSDGSDFPTPPVTGIPVPLPVPPKPPDKGQRKKKPYPSWSPDPTPPHLKEVLSIPKPKLGEKPLEVNPALYWDLDAKAVTRWNRKFDTLSTSGVYRLRESSPGKGDR